MLCVLNIIYDDMSTERNEQHGIWATKLNSSHHQFSQKSHLPKLNPTQYTKSCNFTTQFNQTQPMDGPNPHPTQQQT